MKYLIIYAHPHREGHNGFVLNKLEENLKLEKIDYELLDLYQLNFNPILNEEDLKAQRDKQVSSEIQNYQAKIKNADRLIFIYPTWWQAPPAILKGFIDRVFTSGFAYHYKNGLPAGLLKNKKAAVFTSTGGPKIFSEIFLGSISLKLITRYVLLFCGIKSRGFQIGSARNVEDNKKNLETIVKNILSYLK